MEITDVTTKQFFTVVKQLYDCFGFCNNASKLANSLLITWLEIIENNCIPFGCIYDPQTMFSILVVFWKGCDGKGCLLEVPNKFGIHEAFWK